MGCPLAVSIMALSFLCLVYAINLDGQEDRITELESKVEFLEACHGAESREAEAARLRELLGLEEVE